MVNCKQQTVEQTEARTTMIVLVAGLVAVGFLTLIVSMFLH